MLSASISFDFISSCRIPIFHHLFLAIFARFLHVFLPRFARFLPLFARFALPLRQAHSGSALYSFVYIFIYLYLLANLLHVLHVLPILKFCNQFSSSYFYLSPILFFFVSRSLPHLELFYHTPKHISKPLTKLLLF